jgi:hypothetical protein
VWASWTPEYTFAWICLWLFGMKSNLHAFSCAQLSTIICWYIFPP